MKKFRFMLSAFLLMALSAGFVACSDDDDPKQDPDPTPTPTPTPEPDKADDKTYHFDLFLTIGKHGGMSSKNSCIVRSVSSLAADQGVISITGVGTELAAKAYSMESITKGKYYYQVPYSADRFTKYEITEEGIKIVQEQPFVKNTYKCRQYSYAWLNDNTLVIMAADGDKTHILWTKLNTDNMSIIDEGTLSLEVDTANGFELFTTTGILTYREADNKLFYFYFNKISSSGSNQLRTTDEENFHVAVINAETMAVEHDSKSPVKAEMAGTAYGELLQNITMFDEAGNLYISAFREEDDNANAGPAMLLRINAGENEIDPSYNGFQNGDGKLLTVQYLGNNKAFIYSRNDEAPAVTTAEGKTIKPTAIDGYSHYYSILDLNTGYATRMSYNGKLLEYSGGRFSQRSIVLNGKVYFATNTLEDENSIIYIYDIDTQKVEKGAEVEGTHFFDVIRAVED